jgi:hypothetical protein
MRDSAFLLILTINALIMFLYGVELYSNGSLTTLGWCAFLLAPVPIVYSLVVLASGAARDPY